MKYYYLVTFLSFTIFSAAQSYESIKRDSQTYLWGEGSGSTINRADADALSQLISQISVFVETQSGLETEQSKQDDVFGFNQSFRESVNTYSNATLRNTERIILSDEPNARVFRYVKRSEVDKIFLERQNKIMEFARYGLQACSEAKVADALRYYYWALTLLRSHPGGSSLMFADGSGTESLMATWLHRQINNVFTDIHIYLSDTRPMEDYTMYLLQIAYKGKPAVNFDYSYWTGRNYSSIISSRNGFGTVEIMGNEPVQELRIRAEYVFEGEAAIDQELRDVMQRIDVIPFRKNHFSISLQAVGEEMPEIDFTETTTVSYRSVSEVQDKRKYEAAMNQLIAAVQKKEYESAKRLFTNEGFEIYQSILSYGKAVMIREPNLRYLQYGSDVIVRSIPMRFSFPHNNRDFVEDVVVHFNGKGLIHNVTFGLDQIALNDILREELPWTSEVRWVLTNFMENYKTAFALKRLDYIESIFDDEALIIVGRIVQPSPYRENRYTNNPIVRQTRYSKQQYIRNLRHAFNSNEFINIRFQDNIVSKAGRGGEVYGIQIKQDYFSSNYGDTGYLFLMVDVNEPDTPVIHVRTWQPEKNPDGSIYGLADF